MGWREFWAWCRVLADQREQERRAQVTPADTWDHGRDEWWQSMDAARRAR